MQKAGLIFQAFAESPRMFCQRDAYRQYNRGCLGVVVFLNVSTFMPLTEEILPARVSDLALFLFLFHFLFESCQAV